MSDIEVLDGLKCTVTLGGTAYAFKEPDNRGRREMLADMVDIAERAEKSAGGRLRAINDTVDFLAKHNNRIARNKQAIEALPEAEISEAFKTLFEWLSDPLAKRAAEGQPADE